MLSYTTTATINMGFFDFKNSNTTPKILKLRKVLFPSSSHVRYENGQVVITSTSDANGNHVGCRRGIMVEPNIDGGENYTVTIYNMDVTPPDIQMAPKQMKIISSGATKTILRGYGSDAFGNSFEDYGLTIYHMNNIIIRGSDILRVILHMHDRNIDIAYTL